MKTETIQIGYDRSTSQPIYEERPVRVNQGGGHYVNRDTHYSRDFVDYLSNIED